MDYVIFTDTSANLPDKVVREYGLRLIPFFYCPPEHPEGIPCPGSEEFDGSAYYNAIRGGAVVTTSQINVHQYVNAMDPVLEAGHDILFVGMSSGISGAYHSATQAAHILSEQYPERRIRTVDTLSASLGEGLLVIEAAKMRDAGVGLDEVADRLNSYVSIQLGLSGGASMGYQQQMVSTATLMLVAPLLVLYLFAQRSFVESIAASGIKG